LASWRDRRATINCRAIRKESGVANASTESKGTPAIRMRKMGATS
jgi:hypothetical protein